MPLEVGTFINDLVVSNPVGATDPVSEGDNHLRLIKTVLKNTFPGLVGAGFRVQTKSANYIVVANDNTTLIRCTTTLTVSLTASATLGNQHVFYVFNDSTGLITIDPNGSELINNQRLAYVLPKQLAIVFCDGTQFFTLEDGQTYVNPIYNSGMELSLSFAGTSATVSDGQRRYPVEGFIVDVVGVSAQVVAFRSTNVPSVGVAQVFLNNSLNIQNKVAKAAQSAGNRTQIEHIIEGYDFQKIAQRPFWFSFMCKSSETGTYNISFKNAGRDRSYVDYFVITAVDTWTRQEFLVEPSPAAGTWDYSEGTGLVVAIAIAGSSTVVARQSWTAVDAYLATAGINWNSAISASFGFAAPNISLGSRPSQWENYGQPYELARANRYFWKTFELDTVPAQGVTFSRSLSALSENSGNFNFSHAYPFPLRISTPTITTFSPSQASNRARNRGDTIDATVTVNTLFNSRYVLDINNAAAANGNTFFTIHVTSNARFA